MLAQGRRRRAEAGDPMYPPTGDVPSIPPLPLPLPSPAAPFDCRGGGPESPDDPVRIRQARTSPANASAAGVATLLLNRGMGQGGDAGELCRVVKFCSQGLRPPPLRRQRAERSVEGGACCYLDTSLLGLQ